jgi:hypothetical protein
MARIIEDDEYDFLINQINELSLRNAELECLLKTRDLNLLLKKQNSLKRKNIAETFFVEYEKTGLPYWNLSAEDMQGEIWLPILNSDGYLISNFGRVKSSVSRYGVYFHVLKQQKNKNGYLRVTFLKGKKHLASFVHRLVAIHFIPNPENKSDVNHINGNKGDNRVENLEWNTESENIKHAIRTGLKVIKNGQEHSVSKLTNEDVLNIRDELNKKTSQYFLANKYKVTQSCISNIKRGITWSHLK